MRDARAEMHVVIANWWFPPLKSVAEKTFLAFPVNAQPLNFTYLVRGQLKRMKLSPIKMRYNNVTIFLMVHDSRVVSVIIVRNYAVIFVILVYDKYLNMRWNL